MIIHRCGNSSKYTIKAKFVNDEKRSISLSKTIS